MAEIRSDRRRRGRSLFALLSPLVVSVAAPSIALAQVTPSAASPSTPSTPAAPPAPPTKEQLAEAKKFFDAGLKLSKEGLYQEALASFIEANRLAPRESIQRNIAQTYRDLKDMANAYEATKDLLALYGEKMKPTLKSNAQHALEELEVLTGVIDVTVQEPGAKVTLDGKEVGVTPLAKPLRVGIGTHALTVAKEGFETLTQPVEIHGHDTATVAGPLAKEITTGHVTVAVTQTNPPDPTVRVFIDGKDVGAPPYQVDLDPGMHTIEAKGTTAVAPARPLEVTKKGTYAETLELHTQQGSLAVNVDVADTEISVDGNVVAHGVYEGMLAAGPHTLQVTKAGFAPYKKDFLVHDADKLTENVALQRDRSTPVAAPHD
ncbi:MAG TPA: PEGA domain-containing protein, partial [Polyangiaceae bacterium]